MWLIFMHKTFNSSNDEVILDRWVRCGHLVFCSEYYEWINEPLDTKYILKKKKKDVWHKIILYLKTNLDSFVKSTKTVFMNIYKK